MCEQTFSISSSSKLKLVESIIFSKQNKPSKIYLYLGNTIVRQVNNVKILEITFDLKLMWKSYTTKLKEDGANCLSILKITAAKNWEADQSVFKNT